MRKYISLALSTLFVQTFANGVTCTPSSSGTFNKINQGQTCIMPVNQTVAVSGNVLKNNGKLVFKLYSKLEFGNQAQSVLQAQDFSITTDNNNRGMIVVDEESSIFIKASGAKTNTQLTIENQDIELARWTNFAIDVKSLILDKQTKITSQGSGKLVLGSDSLSLKNSAFKNLTTTSETLNTMNVAQSEWDQSSLTSKKALNITSSIPKQKQVSASTFTLKNQNNIETSEKLTLSGDFSFGGGGSLIFGGKQVEVGASIQPKINSAETITKLSGNNSKEKEKTTIGFYGSESVSFQKVEIDDLSVQIIKDGNEGAILKNIDATFNGGTLEGRGSKGESQVLVIENGNFTPQGKVLVGEAQTIQQGKITINQNNTPSNTSKNKLTGTTFQGAGIKIYGQDIKIQGQTALTLKTDEDNGVIALGKANTQAQSQTLQAEQPQENKDGEVIIQGTNGTNGTQQNLNLQASSMLFDGNLTLKNLSIQTKSKNSTMTFQGKNNQSTLILDSVDLTIGMPDEKGVGNFQALIFSTEDASKQSNIKLNSNVSFKAQSFSFKNQNLSLNNGKSNTLNLYAYGDVALKETTPTKVGNFAFYDTSFNGSQAENVALVEPANGASTLKLYAGSDGAKILSSNFTLQDSNLESYLISSSGSVLTTSSPKASLDLSDRSSNLTALGGVNISAKDFKYRGSDEGVGMDLFVGNGTKVGNLVLKSGENGGQANKTFILGGVLTIDNSASTNGKEKTTGATASSFDIELGSNKLSEGKIDLIIKGGIRSIGKISQTPQNGVVTEIKAKTFKFSKDSIAHSKNGTLKLSSSDGKVEVKGKTILDGSASAEASIEAGQISNGAGLQKTNPMLTLHDIEAIGKTKLENNFTLSNSNILVRSNGKDNTFTIKSSNGKITGIASLTLQDGILDAKNASNGAELELNQGAVITSSGISEVKTAGISVSRSTPQLLTTNTNTFSLKVLDGTLTLTETTAKNAIGAITLGSEKSLEGGNLILSKGAMNARKTEYNALQFKDSLQSFGDSSITASSFSVDSSTKNFSISSTGGELKLMAKGSAGAQGLGAGGTNSGLSITNGEIKLTNGTLSFYTDSTQQQEAPALGEIKLGAITLGNNGVGAPLSTQETKITSIGSSKLQASKNGLTLKETEISAIGGQLALIGLNPSSTLGNVFVGNAGTLFATDEDQSQNRVGLKIANGKTITLSSNSPYVSSVSPLGGGSFGRIYAKSVSFEGNSTGKLINLVIKPENTLQGRELFSLREGEQILIDTTEGITKKTGVKKANGANGAKITLEDISLDYGGYKSLILTPILQENEQKDKVLILKLGIAVKQNTISELLEGIKDPNIRNQMSSIVLNGKHREILDSLLAGGENALKIGMAENIIAGNIPVSSEAIYLMSDAFESVANLVRTNYKVYEQIASLTFGILENRLARGGNPHKEEEKLANLLKQASKNVYANRDDDLLLEDEKTNEIGGLWASYDGSMRVGKNASSSINGLSAGYDAILQENYLLGGYINYLYGAYNGNYLHNTSHNINFGLYSRMFFGSNEVDLVLSQSVGLNTSRLNLGYAEVATLLNGEMDYNFYATNFQTRYGYSFSLGEEESPYYLKPFVGIDMTLIYNKETQTNAISALKIGEMQRFYFDMTAGLELRKYFNPQSYFFVMPLVQVGLLNQGDNAQVGFISSYALPYELEDKRDINLGIYAGGQGRVAENLAVTGSLGIRMGVKNTDVLTSWNVGLKYKF